MPKTILVTGGAGFIGSHVAAGFADRSGFRVVVCDKFGSGEKWNNLAKHRIDEIIPPEELFHWLEQHEAKLEAVYHMGGVASTVESNVDLMLDVNFSLSTKLWRWCAAKGKRLIYASAATTYGTGEQGFDDSADTAYLRTLRPFTASAWMKHVFDQFAAGQVRMKEAAPPQWVGLKFFNLYGPNEYHKETQKSVICKLAPHARAGQAAKLYKSFDPRYPDGGQSRDFIYVKDATRIMLWLYDNPQFSGILNVGTGQSRTFNDMAHALFNALGQKPQISYVDMPPELTNRYQYFTQANLERLRAAGYTESFTSLEDGIKDYVQNYLLKNDPYF